MDMLTTRIVKENRMDKNRHILKLDSVTLEKKRLEDGDTSVELDVEYYKGDDCYIQFVYLSLIDQKEIVAFLQDSINRWDTEDGVAALKRAKETRQEREARLAAEAAKPKLVEYELEYLIEDQKYITHIAKVKATNLNEAADILKGTMSEAITLVAASISHDGVY